MRPLAFLLLLFSISAFADEGDYHWNLQTSPINWVVGPNLRVDTKVADQWTVGVAGSSIDRKIKAVNMSGKTGGLLLNYAFNSPFDDTWFLDLGISYGDIRAEAKSESGQVFNRRLYNSAARLSYGYHWFWDHFNLALAAGADWNSAGGKYVLDDGGNNLERIPIRSFGFLTELAIGLAF
ncbi:MAG: DUF3575 domain-containing protein [Bdellovibrionales bacterium]